MTYDDLEALAEEVLEAQEMEKDADAAEAVGRFVGRQFGRSVKHPYVSHYGGHALGGAALGAAGGAAGAEEGKRGKGALRGAATGALAGTGVAGARHLMRRHDVGGELLRKHPHLNLYGGHALRGAAVGAAGGAAGAKKGERGEGALRGAAAGAVLGTGAAGAKHLAGHLYLKDALKDGKFSRGVEEGARSILEKQSSAFETLAELRAREILLENGIDPDEE